MKLCAHFFFLSPLKIQVQIIIILVQVMSMRYSTKNRSSFNLDLTKTYPPMAILVSDWFKFKKSFPQNLQIQMNFNFV